MLYNTKTKSSTVNILLRMQETENSVFQMGLHSSWGTRPSLEIRLMGASSCLERWPTEDLAPLRHMMEARRSEKESRHWIQPIVVE